MLLSNYLIAAGVESRVLFILKPSVKILDDVSKANIDT